MIYGYDSQTVNEYGLKQMREISLAISAGDLREFADFLLAAADALEGASSFHWHRHAPSDLSRKIGCDVIVLNGKPEVRK